MVTRLYRRLHMTHWPTARWLRVVIVSVGVIASILPTANAASTAVLAAQGAAHPLMTHIQMIPVRSAHTSALPAITVTPEKQATTVPTPTPPSQPTATPQATVTPQPTATPQPSPTPQPTSTAQPTATPRPEPSVVPTATPISTVNNANAGFAILSIIVLLLCFVVIGLIVWLVARRNMPVAVPPQERVAQGLPGSYVPPADPRTPLSPEVYPGVVEPNGSNSTTVPGGVGHVRPQPDTTQPNPLPSPGAPGSPSSGPTSDKVPEQQKE